MKQELIILSKNNFGVDLDELYQIACYSSGLPLFENIYQEYKFRILNENLNLSVGVIEEQLVFLKKGMLPEKEKEAEELILRTEAELFYYLLTHQYSIEDKGKKFNLPIRGVW